MSNKLNKIFRFLKRFLIIGLSIITFLLLLSVILFYFYKDEIGETILLQTNKMQNGEMIFKDVSFNPFVHFPNVSIELDSALYYEKPAEERGEDSMPMIEIDRLYLAFDLLDLIRGDINISKVLLEDGSLNLVTYADSTLNLMKAFDTDPDTLSVEKDTARSTPKEFELNLDRIALKNIVITHHYLPSTTDYIYDIQSLKASFNYRPDTIKSSVDANVLLVNVKLTDHQAFVNKEIRLKTSLTFGRRTSKLIIEPSRLAFEKSSFNVEGYLDLKHQVYMNLALKGDNKNFGILDLFLTNAGIENVQKGNLFFEGTIKGKLHDGIPMMDFSFGMDEVEILIPNIKEKISNLSLDGDFKSGNKADMSAASLDIRQMTAQLPGGRLDGKLTVKDFVSPEFDLSFYLKSKLDGFHEIFDLGKLDSLAGGLEVKSEIKGKLNPDEETFDEFTHNSTLRFDSISFVIPGINRVRKMHGRIEVEKDTMLFKDFDLFIGTSDFRINGRAINAMYTFLDMEKEIEAHLRIKSEVYDFPDFFSWDQRTATNFPYRIKDLNLSVNTFTSTTDLKEFVVVPKIIFNIQHLAAEIEDFLPPVSIKKGLFTLADKDSSLHLDFDRFSIDMAGSKLKTEMDYYSPPVEPDWMSIELDATGLNPKTTFVHWFNDSIGDYLDGILNARMHLDLVLSTDSLINFDKLDFKAKKIDYTNKQDTFNLSGLRFDSKNIGYDLSESSNILKTLSLESKLTARTTVTNHFELDDLDYDITAKNGTYHIQPQNSQFFDQIGDGYVIISPYGEKPSYEFKYKVSQFDVAALFATFLEDTILTGRMDLDLDVKFLGDDWEEIKNNLDGHILISGHDLTLCGIDLDKVIDRFKRSQRFTFADLGGVLLMGPIGLVVTKGTDFARLAILNPGEFSEVMEISSDWKFDEGVISLADVAFTTQKNRVAGKGYIDIKTDSLDVQIALLNSSGCNVFSQDITGTLVDPELGKVKVVKSLFAPLTNMVKDVAGTDCDVFYDGRVKQPR